MTLTFRTLIEMAWRSVTTPREGAEEVLALGLPREAIWPFLLLVVVLSAILGQLTTFLLLGPDAAQDAGLLALPAVTGFVQLAVLVVTIFAIYHIGRAFGGTGSFNETAILMGWLQFIMVCLQVVQTGLMVFAPPVASIVGILAIVLFLWLLTNFIAVIHGFRSLAQVFIMILVSMFTIAFALSVLLSMLGVMPQGASL